MHKIIIDDEQYKVPLEVAGLLQGTTGTSNSRPYAFELDDKDLQQDNNAEYLADIGLHRFT